MADGPLHRPQPCATTSTSGGAGLRAVQCCSLSAPSGLRADWCPLRFGLRTASASFPEPSTPSCDTLYRRRAAARVAGAWLHTGLVVVAVFDPPCQLVRYKEPHARDAVSEEQLATPGLKAASISFFAMFTSDFWPVSSVSLCRSTSSRLLPFFPSSGPLGGIFLFVPGRSVFLDGKFVRQIRLMLLLPPSLMLALFIPITPGMIHCLCREKSLSGSTFRGGVWGRMQVGPIALGFRMGA